MALNVLYGILLLCGQTAARSDGFCTEIEGNGLAFLYNFTRPARAYRGQTMARAAHAFSWPDVYESSGCQSSLEKLRRSQRL